MSDKNKTEWPIKAIKDVSNLLVADTHLLLKVCEAAEAYKDGVIQKPGTARTHEKMNIAIIAIGSPFDVGGNTISEGDAVVFGGHSMTAVAGIGAWEEQDRYGILLKDDVIGALIKPEGADK